MTHQNATQLLFHLDVHGRSSCLACGETAKGIDDDAQPPRVHPGCRGDRRLARVGRHGSRVSHGWRERRDLYPEGVASGDPDPNSVILWTRRPFEDRAGAGEARADVLTVEVAEDEAFRRVVAHAPAPVSAASDWTTRVLVGGLKPARVYWYRFTDADGNGSRVGRTITAPPADDPRPVNFAFVSCQDVNEGKLNAYRRMIFEDERARARRPARFRPAPRRLHLRGRRIPGRGEDPLRPHDLRGRAHSRRQRSATSTSR